MSPTMFIAIVILVLILLWWTGIISFGTERFNRGGYVNTTSYSQAMLDNLRSTVKDQTGMAGIDYQLTSLLADHQ